MFFNTEKNDHGLPHNPFKSLVVPRPIGWISTYSRDRVPNLAPFSYFNAVSTVPPFVMFASGGHPPDGRTKDSAQNAEDCGVFCVNLVAYGLHEQMNATADAVPPDVDEFKLAGLKMGQARMVDAPVVADAPVHLECTYHETLVLPGGGPGQQSRVIFGRVVGIYIDDACVTAEGRVDVAKIRPVARLGYMDYTSVESIFSMPKLMPEDAEASG